MIQRRLTKGGQVRWDVRIKRLDRSEYSKTFRTKKEAERWEAMQIADKARGSWVDPQSGRITFDGWADEWFQSTKHTWRSRTAEKHELSLRVHWKPRLGRRELSSITPRMIQGAINEMASTMRPASVRTYYGTLRSLLADALVNDLIGRTPCRGIKLPKSDDVEKRVVTPIELHRLADSAGPQWRCLMLVTGSMGLRFGEVAALRLMDIDLEAGQLAVCRTLVEVNGRVEVSQPKTTAGIRSLAIPSKLVDELRTHIDGHKITEPTDLLFKAPNGGVLRRGTFRQRVFNPAVKRAGLEGLTFHGLRHSAATQWVALGIDVRTAQHRLGHSDPRLILRLYAHAATDADKRAAEIIDSGFWPGGGTDVGMESESE